MECMTVLKRPNVVELETLENGGFQATLPHKPWTVWQTSRRSCSQGLLILLVMMLLLVLFTSQLMLYTQFQELRKQLKENDKKLNGMAEQVLSEKLFKNSRHTKASWKKSERNELIRRHVSQQAAGFVFRGDGLDSDGVFKWSGQGHSYIIGGVSLESNRKKVEIRFSGMYSVTVQINVKGRRRTRPAITPITYWICRDREGANGTRSEVRLDKVVLTQDDRGQVTYLRGGTVEDFPVDSMTYSGMLYLKRDDRLYVKRPNNERNDNTVEFDNTADSGHFSAHLIGPEGPSIVHT